MNFVVDMLQKEEKKPKTHNHFHKDEETDNFEKSQMNDADAMNDGKSTFEDKVNPKQLKKNFELNKQ